MRMRVALGGHPMSRPAGVGNTHRGAQTCSDFLQLDHATGRPQSLQIAIQNSYACGVVSSIFKPLKTFNQDWDNIAPCYCTDYSTHCLDLREGLTAPGANQERV